MKSNVISSSPEIMGGTPVFAGTRVPVQTLLDYIEGGESIDNFLEGFPSVKRTQVIAFLEDVKKLIASLEQEFDVFVTTDRNLGFQQNVANLSI